MGRVHERQNDVLNEGVAVLGRTAAFAASEAANLRQADVPDHLSFASLEAAACRAVDALLALLQSRVSDSRVAESVCDAIGEILDTCSPTSPVRERALEGLFAKDGQSADLLSRVAVSHASNLNLQSKVIWVSGVVHGAVSVIQEMERHCATHALQLPAMKTLSVLYTTHPQTERRDAMARPSAVRAVVSAMEAFPANLDLQQSACNALAAIVETHLCRGGEADVGVLSEDLLATCLRAAHAALSLVLGCSDSGHSASHRTLLVKKDAVRLMGSVCSVAPSLSTWLRESGQEQVLTNALVATADRVADGSRDEEVEDVLRIELIALSHVSGACAAIIEPLRRWGPSKPAVVRAAADAVVELARHESSAPPGSLLRASVQELCAAGCGGEFVAAMRTYPRDEELHTRMQLALGFLGTGSSPLAVPS